MEKINLIGKNIKLLRSYKGLRQQDLADCIGQSKQFISRVEKGSSLPSEYLKPIANKLGLDNPFDLIEKKFTVLGGTVER
jgi:transcriptional regulator with XRE-family HTH domain